MPCRPLLFWLPTNTLPVTQQLSLLTLRGTLPQAIEAVLRADKARTQALAQEKELLAALDAEEDDKYEYCSNVVG